MLDIDNESLKLYNVSENIIISNSLNDNFQTINSSKITNIYKNKKTLKNHSKIPSLIQLEKNIHNYFKDLYYHDKYFYNIKVINDIINNLDTHLVAEFKDYLIMGDESEFLQKKYNMKECKKYLPILFDYYKSCSIIFPNYVILHENKYIFKNIRKKQKVIDNQQEQEDKQEKIKKGEIKIEENNAFFTSNALNSILNQTNTSNVKIFFGLNNNKNNNKNNDSEDTVNNIFKNIENAEHNAFLAKKNYILKKNKLKNLMKIGKIDESKSQNNINNISNNANNKLNKIKKINIFNKNIKPNPSDRDKNKINSNKINNGNNNLDKKNKISNINTDTDINVLYSNINNLTKSKNIIKLNNKTRHVKSNTCIFETDSNIFLQKKLGNLIKNNSSKKKVYNKNNSNRKIFNIKEKEKKTKITNKEIIARITAKIKNAKNAIIQGNSSFNNINKKRLILNITKFNNPSSISPHNKNNSNVKRKNNCELIININESNSTPNIYNFKVNKIIKYKNNIANDNNKNSNKNEKQILKEDIEKNSQPKLLTVKNDLSVSPLNKILLKNESYRIRNNNNTKNNNANNFISKTIKNKIKKGEKEKQKVNIDIYKITPNTLAQRYITTNNNKNDALRASNKAMTISNIKNITGAKFNSIKVYKKTRNINSKMKKSDINNNININININSNNIFNNSNQINNLNKNISNSIHNINNSNNNNILNKKKYYEILRQSSSFISNRNETHHHQILKRMLLSASNNNIFNNSKKNDIFEDLNKKKNSVLNTNNTLTFSGYLTSRNSLNTSKINKKSKKDNNNTTNNNKIGNMKSNITSYKVKKELFNGKIKIITPKNKIPMGKSPKGNNIKGTKNKFKI